MQTANGNIINLDALLFGVNPVEIVPESVALPNYEPSKCSARRNGVVRAYAANTN